MDDRFPRALTTDERELLLWILPAERPGYKEYRTFVENWNVVSQGRRGEGNYILAAPDEQPDNESPLPQIIAHGSIVTPTGELSVSIRERLENQVEFEIVGVQGNVDPARFNETRRWTLSSWLPSQVCPKCGVRLREVSLSSEHGRTAMLAVCATDKRLWVYDERTGINHPIPVTNFYNELMLHKNIRDPKIALDSKRLFSDLSQFSDAELSHAFRTYNALRTKIQLEGNIVVEDEKPNLVQRLKQLIRLEK